MEKTGESGWVSFGRLFFSSLPDLWVFHIIAGLVITFPAMFLIWLLKLIASSTGEAVTTANLMSFILSWRFPIVLGLGFLLVILFIILELFTQIHMCKDILDGKSVGIITEVKASFQSFRLFLNPSGIGTILFIVVAVPLCGIGFAVSLTESFYIPNFIMDYIESKLFLAIGYVVLILFLLRVVYRSAFTLHGVLLDGMHPKEAKKQSAALVKENRKAFLLGILKTVVVIIIAQVIVVLLFRQIPEFFLERSAQRLPAGYEVDAVALLKEGSPSGIDLEVIGFRIASIVYLTIAAYLENIAALLSGTYFLLRLTCFYRAFTKGSRKRFPKCPKKHRVAKILFLVVLFFLILAGACLAGLNYDQIFDWDMKTGIIAHRAGGKMAVENTVAGLEKAIEHGCYGSEIDIHRTKDGQYIVNHDDDFKRLGGVAKAPKDMTMEEIQKIRLRDAYGSRDGEPVATLEEMLDTIKGKEKLFIELKGVTADRQMVDDVVAMVREKDCVDDVVLISLKYNVISYAETTYPEFETGILFFAGLGDFAKLNCDILIIEEEMGSAVDADELRQAGKKVIVWTVNTEESMKRFLDSRIFAIITDYVELAGQVQEELDRRNDLEVARDSMRLAFKI